MKLIASNKGSFHQQEKWLEEYAAENDTEATENSVTVSTSHSKIQFEELVEDENVSTPRTWQKVTGRAIVSGKILQDKLDKSVACRFCQGSVKIIENVLTKSGLGSTWVLCCENEDCLS